MLCISSDPIVPYIFALQCIAAIIAPVLMPAMLVVFGRTESKKKFSPAVSTFSYAAMFVVFTGGVVLAVIYAGEPCPQPQLRP